ncbi:MAG: UvrD-helicase domain-containing protein, partial [Candidatus Bathyarchaeia archaeon]
MDLITELNSRQREAVMNTSGPVLVLAGVGSGKTRVLTYRIAYMIERGIANPWNILAMTFTNRAADEMRDRVRSLIKKADADVLVSTFHSVCVRVLRGHAHHLGYGNNFVIYDEKDQLSMIETCLKELDIDPKVLSPDYVQYRISRSKENLISPEEFTSSERGDRLERRFGRVWEYYQKRMRDSNAVDFDDLIYLTVKLFGRYPEVLRYYQNRWRFVLIDEFQDTNYAQYEMVKMLCRSHRNIFVVGDDDQSIYSWRGANPVNIHYFERDFPEAKVIKLEENYRSTKRILRASSSVIRHNAIRKEKDLWTQNQEGEPVVLYRASDERDEVKFVLDNIERGIKLEGWKFSDISIFYRTHAQSRVFEEEMLSRNLPYSIYGGVGFYERKEIKDIISYLRIVENPADSVSWRRVINTPRRGIGKATVERIEEISRRESISFEEAMRRFVQEEEIKGGGRKRVGDLLDMIGHFREKKGEISIEKLTRSILEDTGYLSYLEGMDPEESRQRLMNVSEFFHLILEFEMREGEGGLSEFLQGISLLSDIDRMESSDNRISMMTLHSAKGLAFPVVFIVGMEEGLFPHRECIEPMDRLEEERRLCYVGMTRAKRRLFLTCARRRWRFGNEQRNSPSRFITEIPEEVLLEIRSSD